MKWLNVFMMFACCMLVGRTHASIEIPGNVIVKTILPEGKTFSSSSVQISLRSADQSEEISAFVKNDGGFLFHAVKPGAYLLEVRSVDYNFIAERLEVREEDDSSNSNTKITKIRCKLFDERRNLLRIPLDQPAVYFPTRPTFDPLSLLKSPMVMMMGFSCLMIFIMPKLQASVDPAELKEMQGENRVILADGSEVARDSLIPQWNPPLPRQHISHSSSPSTSSSSS